jgi:S-phase kinase-associated protein 1
MESDQVKLQSKEGQILTISKKAAELSVLIKNNLIDFSIEQAIPLDEVNEKILELIIRYLNHYNGVAPTEIEKPLKSNNMKDVVDEFSAGFINELELNDLIDLTVAANFMEIQTLLDLCTAKIASMCKDKSEEEIFKTFGITDQFTEEERAKVKEENLWLEDNIN